MLQPDPLHRPSINEILASEWMLGEQPTKKEIVQELSARASHIDLKIPNIDVNWYIDKKSIINKSFDENEKTEKSDVDLTDITSYENRPIIQSLEPNFDQSIILNGMIK